MKKVLTIFLVSILILALTACSTKRIDTLTSNSNSHSDKTSGERSVFTTDTEQDSVLIPSDISAEYDSDDLDSSIDNDDVSYIKLDGDSITFEIAIDLPRFTDVDGEFERLIVKGAKAVYTPRDEP